MKQDYQTPDVKVLAMDPETAVLDAEVSIIQPGED